MRRNVIRSSFIAISLSLCLGNSLQARAMNGGCDGRSTTHRKPDDVVSFVGMVFHKLTAHHDAIPCQVATKTFVPPQTEVRTVQDTNIDTSDAPAFGVNPDVSMLPVSTMANILPMLPPPPVTTPTTPAPKRAQKKSFEVKLNISREAAHAKGITPGTYPALLVANQRQDGQWKKRVKLAVTVQEVDNGFLCSLIFRNQPPSNAKVEVDFGNGDAETVKSELLAEAERSNKQVLKPLNKKAYLALEGTFPARPNQVLAMMGLLAPTALQVGVGVAIGNPIAVFMAPASLLANIATRKIARSQRSAEAAMHPSLRVDYEIDDQNARIEELRDKVALLEERLHSLGLTETIDKEDIEKERKQ